MSATSAVRQDWLERAIVALRPYFAKQAYTIPHNVRVSIGFPKGGRGKKAIGQCWTDEATNDGHFEIFVSPEIGAKNGLGLDTVEILGVLAHECVHATVGLKAGHKGPFKQCAEAIGLEGKMTATKAGDAFRSWAQEQIDNGLGEFPAGALSPLTKVGKQPTRLLKAECPDCGYTVRVTKKWADLGAPICPVDEIAMNLDGAATGGDAGEE